MKRKFMPARAITITMLCMLVWVGGSGHVAFADWPHLSPDEMEEQADLIVMGTVGRPIMEKETANNQNGGYTDWEVTVKQYLKTDGPLHEKIVVTTPGNRTNVGISISTEYALDEKGAEVLLFLERSGETLRPFNPMAVIALNGDQLSNDRGKEDERAQLQALLDHGERFAAERGTVSEQYAQLMAKSNEVNKQKLSATAMTLISAVVVAGIGIIIAVYVIYNRRSKP